MSDEMPVYLVGDTIKLRMELEHDFHLGAVAALFYRGSGEGTGLVFEIEASEIREVGRTGTTMKSVVTFEKVIEDTDSLPGVYDLQELTAKPLGKKRKSMLLDDKESREEKLSFRIEGEPKEKSSKVGRLELERPAKIMHSR